MLGKSVANAWQVGRQCFLYRSAMLRQIPPILPDSIRDAS